MAEYITKVLLPSCKADVYPDNPEFKEPIVLRMITAEDEIEASGVVTDALDTLIRRCVKTDKLFDSKKLFPEDRMFLLVSLRCHTYGTEYHGQYSCDACDFSGEVAFDIQRDVQVFELPEDYKEPFELKLPVSGQVVQMRKLRSGDLQAATNTAKSVAKALHKNQRSLEKVEMMKRRLVGVGGKAFAPTDAEQFLLKMVGRDRAFTDAMYEKYHLGYDDMADCICPQCGAEGRVPFVLTGEFLHPRFD